MARSVISLLPMEDDLTTDVCERLAGAVEITFKTEKYEVILILPPATATRLRNKLNGGS